MEEKDLKWLQEFEDLAEEVLSDQESSGCDQVHPIIEEWYAGAMQNTPPTSRSAVMQAMACLTTEILNDMPEGILNAIAGYVDDEELAFWIQEILMLGRAFEQSLNDGTLDDL